MMVRSACSAVLVSTLMAFGGGTPAFATAIARSDSVAGPSTVTVKELDVSGVRADALADLPATAPAPDEASAADAPLATDQPTPSASASHDPAPAEATASEPTSAPTASATAPAEVPAPDVLTTQLSTNSFTVFGVTWDPGPQDVVIRYRVRESGAWSEWQAVGASDAIPDANRAEAADTTTRGGTDPIVASHADGVQIWAQAATGKVTGVKVVLIDPGTRAADAAPAAATVANTSARTTTSTGATVTSAVFRQASATIRTVASPAQPSIISRAGWGADESLRTCEPDYSTGIVSAAVHHTASANNYAPEDVPGIIRGFYAYHTRPEADGGRGWCDIGYNFLVDRFGRIFEGRAGGIASTVIGVHTGGFNSRTIGIAAIGDFSTAAVPAALTESLSQLIAWKFSIHRIMAGATVQMVSGGGESKYPLGTVVEFPTIYGHRDAGLTACPGQNLYDLLPAIRARVAELSNESVTYSPAGAVDSVAGTATGVRVAGWALDPETSAPLQVEVAVDGAVSSLTADQDRSDIGQLFPSAGSRHGFSGNISAAGGRHVVCLRAVNVGQGSSTVLGCSAVTVRNSTPIGYIDAVTATATGVVVSGWALDPDTTAPIAVHVYVDGSATAVQADGARPDVASVYGDGDQHGFSVAVPATSGAHQVCVYAIDSQGGVNPLLGCRSVAYANPTPIGSFDIAVAGSGTVFVGGWALDPDTSAPINVHVYVDNNPTVVTADGTRPDVASIYHDGDQHGFSATLTTTTGTHTVCIYGINTPAGTNTLLGCKNVTVANPTPIGSFDVAVAGSGTVFVGGWALDPDTSAPINVHVYVDNNPTVVTADGTRPDVASIYHDGDQHGFSATLTTTTGTHTVCIYGINTPAGTNTLLGCKNVTVG